MGADVAANILFKKPIEAAADQVAERRPLADDYRQRFSNT